MLVSILIPIFNETENIELLYDEITLAMAASRYDYEVLFIDDGSSDGSAEILENLGQKDSRVRFLQFRRNFGQTAALMAGLDNCVGDIVIPMDGDLQNDPNDIPRLLGKLEEGYDVISGWRRDRSDGIVRKFLSRVASALLSRIFRLPLHDYGCTLKAYKRDILKNVRLYGEMHRFIPIYASWEGARVVELVVNHRPRRFGRSKYGMGRVIRVILDILLLYFLDRAFDRPIQFFGKIGVNFLLLATAIGIGTIVLRIFAEIPFIKTPLPLLVTTLGLSGILFVLLGVVAEIQIRTFFEASGRKSYSLVNKRPSEKPSDPA